MTIGAEITVFENINFGVKKKNPNNKTEQWGFSNGNEVERQVKPPVVLLSPGRGLSTLTLDLPGPHNPQPIAVAAL